MKITGQLAKKGFHAFDADLKTHQGHKISRTWVIIANQDKAHIYRKTETGLELIADAECGGANDASFDRHFFKTSVGKEKHSKSRDGKNSHGDLGFIHRLAEWLDMAANEHVFDYLVLVAEPHTLGHIRASLTAKVSERVTSQLDKDLMKTPLQEIQKHLDGLIWANHEAKLAS